MDKIFINDFVKDIEIGAYQSEIGCTQSVRFSVALEILGRDTDLQDDVDKVLSYEVIINAINGHLQNQRFNLLETLAEKIAETCLSFKRVFSALVKIEKLDRIPGSMGVSIFRSKPNRSRGAITDESLIADIEDCSLFFISNKVLSSPSANNWVKVLKKWRQKATILLAPLPLKIPENLTEKANSQFQLISMDQSALIFSSNYKSITIVGSKSELNWARNNDKLSVLCPSQFVLRAAKKPPMVGNGIDKFVLWFAKELGVKSLFWICAERDHVLEDSSQGLIKVVSLMKDDWKNF